MNYSFPTADCTYVSYIDTPLSEDDTKRIADNSYTEPGKYTCKVLVKLAHGDLKDWHNWPTCVDAEFTIQAANVQQLADDLTAQLVPGLDRIVRPRTTLTRIEVGAKV